MSTATKSRRVKAVVLSIREEFEIVVERVAIHTTKLREQEAARDSAIQQIQAAYADEITRLANYIKSDVVLCERYADEHRAELLPGKAKSNETPLARYGFRLGNRTVQLLNRKITWEEIVGVLKARKYFGLVRVIEEVNKEQILSSTDEYGTLRAARDVEGMKVPTSTALVSLGMKIKQAETFYIEPKVDGAEKVSAAAGGES